jgi:hypothetical protein
MNYSTLEEAYNFAPAIPKERRKKRSSSSKFFGGCTAEGFENPRLPPPEPTVIEPDRPAHRRLPPAELLGGGPTENDKSSSISEMLNAFDSDYSSKDYFVHPNSDIKSDDVYRLEPDWTKQFDGGDPPSWIRDRMASREAEVPLTPSPWLDGGSTLWQRIPASRQGDPVLKQAEYQATDRYDELQRKLDSMFQKLETIDQTRSESNHIEIIMFVLGGVFLLFMLDMLVKQGTQATILLAAAGGGTVMNGGFLSNILKLHK